MSKVDRLIITCDGCGKQEFVENTSSARKMKAISINENEFDVCSEGCAIKIAQIEIQTIFLREENVASNG